MSRPYSPECKKCGQPLNSKKHKKECEHYAAWTQKEVTIGK